ncbi:sulfurtransferase [Dechloromonas sp. ZY10]|uniref:sulfurtransferase n=1 Tax=Dechloromonas aquae TaxID=2664436 RepID=UPI0035271D6A
MKPYLTHVDAATLAAHLDAPDWLVIDVRHQLADPEYGERAYAAAHVPGARFLHCDRDLSGMVSGGNGRHPLPDPAVFAARMAGLGLAPTTQVVVYDDAQGMIAGRLWWLLRWLGHEAVALLDGGWAAWLAAGGQIAAGAADAPAAGTKTPQPASTVAVPRPGLTVDADFVQKNLSTVNMCLVDARSPDRYRGENETIDPVGGHIPGARNRFFKDNLLPDGRFKPAAVLRAEWLSLLAGAAPEQVVHQCGSGVSACLNLVAMEIAGLPGARLYPGSWSEWCADPARPLAR